LLPKQDHKLAADVKLMTSAAIFISYQKVLRLNLHFSWFI